MSISIFWNSIFWPDIIGQFYHIIGKRLNCLGKCELEELPSLFHTCDGQCMSTTDPCNNTCIKPDEILCQGQCLNMETSQAWVCNGVCQSLNFTCNDKCFGSDLFKCPLEDKCIPIRSVCSRFISSEKSCKNEIHQSRFVCDNPDKFHLNLNCESRLSVQCPGYKTQQCIITENICDGTYDCNDR